MRAHQAAYPIATMCRVLGLSTSGYYAWNKRVPSARTRSNARLVEQIRIIHECSGGTYGAPRVHAQLRDQGVPAGYNRVARLMRQAQLRGVSRRRWVCTTQRDRRARPAPDLVQRQFSAELPDQLWVADITYIATWEGFLYLAVVLDVFSRKVVGWAMRSHLLSELVLSALDMALTVRRPQQVIHHSDQGTQYTSVAFGARCEATGVRPSMGSVGIAMTTRCARASSRRWSASCLSVSGFAPKQRRRPRCFSSSRAGTTRIDCTPHWAMSRRSTTRGRIIKMPQVMLDPSSAQPSTESGQLQGGVAR